MAKNLELHVTLAAGREVECARFLYDQVQAEVRPILVALAAELVAVHEARVAGSAVVVVAQPAEAERLVSDLRRKAVL